MHCSKITHAYMPYAGASCIDCDESPIYQKESHKALHRKGKQLCMPSIMTSLMIGIGSFRIETGNSSHGLRKNVKKTIFLFSYGAKSVKMNLCYAQKEKKELIGGKT